MRWVSMLSQLQTLSGIGKGDKLRCKRQALIITSTPQTTLNERYAQNTKHIETTDINTSGLLAQLGRALSKMAEVWECLLMKLTAD